LIAGDIFISLSAWLIFIIFASATAHDNLLLFVSSALGVLA
jgi:hypothetical protein